MMRGEGVFKTTYFFLLSSARGGMSGPGQFHVHSTVLVFVRFVIFGFVGSYFCYFRKRVVLECSVSFLDGVKQIIIFEKFGPCSHGPSLALV